MVAGEYRVVERTKADPGAERGTGLPAGGAVPAGRAGPRAVPQPVRIPPELELAAAGRLVSEAAGPQRDGARRLVAAASAHGIDLSLMWGTLDRDLDGRPIRVRHVCLAVPGAGKTAMLVLSGPSARTANRARPGDDADPAAATAELAACASRACRALGTLERERSARIEIAQALPDPSETWAVAAFLEAGFTRVAALAYMRRALPGPPLPDSALEPEWPAGVTVRSVRGAAPGDPDRDLLIEALERSYEDTLDCPGLCGLRKTSDVLDSHRATGRWDGRHWRLVFLGDRPHGCLLLSHCPEQGAVELVYVGLSKALRGRGLGRALLCLGLSRVRGLDADHIACAVDTRNLPALRLYERLGFTVCASRVALVKPIS